MGVIGGDMRFKEIAFDLPYISNEDNVIRIMNEENCLRSNATKIDYEQNWKSKRHEFSLQTRSICSMFERLMGKITTQNCAKLLIECIPYQSDTTILEFSEVCTIKMQFDYDSFILLDISEKKKLILEMVMKGVQALAEKEKLDYKQFVVVYNQILELNYLNKWVWKKSIKSPNKAFSAEVVVSHDVENVRLTILIKDRSGNVIKAQELLTDLPDEYAYSMHLGNLSWLDETTVTLKNKIGDQSWVVSL